eukprot:m.225669 g.225669  ORF g.225669 m.225669 type:complete len:98 (+) comp16755_c0_seq1:92-385(+)
MILQRVANWIANEVIVKSLARSELFQRMAVKTHQHVQTFSKEGTKHFETIKSSEATQKAQEVIGEHVETAKTFGSSFFRNIKAEYKKLEEEGRRMQK